MRIVLLLALIAGCTESTVGSSDPQDPSEDPTLVSQGDVSLAAVPRGRRYFEPVPAVEVPTGEAVYRPNCFGSSRSDRLARNATRGRGAGAAPPSPAPSSAAPMVSGGAPSDGAAGFGGGSGSAPMAEGAVAMDLGAATGSSASSADSFSGARAESSVASRPAPDVAGAERDAGPPPRLQEQNRKVRSIAAAEEQGDMEYEPMPRRVPPPPPEPVLDWGATVYLSNDDSMSLASAQRILWAAQNGRRVQASEVRPHELLNYFSFDTAQVAPSQLFSVQVSAAKTDGDTLSVALAVQGAVPPRKPLDLTLSIDRSGSMRAEGRMEYLKRGLRLMTDTLHEGDRVDVVLFNSSVCTPLEDYVVGRDDPSLLAQTIENLAPGGGTDLNGGLEEAYRLATERPETIHRNQRVMVLTDALLNTGEVNENIVSKIGASFDDRAIRLTGIGVGREFNDQVLDMLTEKGKGAYVYLGSEAVVDRVFGSGFDSLTRTIAHDVHFALDLPEDLAMERFYGEEASTDKADVQPINYYAGTSQVFLQDLTMRAGASLDRAPVKLTITYRAADTGEPETQVWETTVGALMENPRRNLDKARALMAWTDLVSASAMYGDPCGAPLEAWQTRASTLMSSDAEVAYVHSLVTKTCPGATVTPLSLASTYTYKVKVDADIAIPEVSLACPGFDERERLSGSDTVARFQAPAGECTLTLQGMVPMTAQVSVPETETTVRCMVRGGQLSCG